ncbi:hypothetical protein [Sphingobium sp. B2]|uniref:hypothetical protein n=1 Tax=Sphingobium sp. B2 TaxID=2583228 RepID=UPI0011A9C4C2|nr:hypothetical protein [Sphingobium sp. B2]
MTGTRRDRREMVFPLLISTLMHAALLLPLSIPQCTGITTDEETGSPKRIGQAEKGDAIKTAIAVDIGQLRILPRTLHHTQEVICDPGAIPEWYRFDIRPGPVEERIRQVARQSSYGVVIGMDFVAGRSSRGLRGWFRPHNAMRLLAGDVGLCAVDMGDTINVRPCGRSATLISRASEPLLRQEREPPDCTVATPSTVPIPPSRPMRIALAQ